jgi:thioesterase domain-containing protein
MRRKFYTILRHNAKSIAIVPESTQVIALQPMGERPPFFIVDSYPYFIDVVKLIGNDQPILSLIDQDDTQTSKKCSLQDEACAHVKNILAHQPHGPYMLGGCSASGIVAYEIAQQLRLLGHEVALLVLFESPNPYFMREYSKFWTTINCYRVELSKLSWNEIPGWALKKLRERGPEWLAWTHSKLKRTSSEKDQFEPLWNRVEAARNYCPAPYSGRFLLVKRDRELFGRYRDPYFGWGEVVQGKIEITKVSSPDHLEIFKSEVDRFSVAQRLRKCIDEAIEASYVTKAHLQHSQTQSRFG